MSLDLILPFCSAVLSLFLPVVSLDVPELRADESTWEHGETQAPSCRNWFWAILFLCQVAGMVALAVLATIALAKGEYQLPTDDDEYNHKSWFLNLKVTEELLFLIVTILSITLLSAVLILLLLGTLADLMIQVSLVVSPIACGFSALGSLLLGQIGAALFLGIFCVLGVVYAVTVWHRIPFATANLAVAMAAIHVNKGLFTMAYATTILAAVWTLIWIMATAQVSVVQYEWIMKCEPSPSGHSIDDDMGDSDDLECHLTTQGKWILVGLLLSLYWTSQVIKNVFHTTIAGVVGTFWFTPANENINNNGGCCGCNSTIFDAWVRSSVYSFGSICLGSLLVAVLQVLQILVRLARHQNENNNNRGGHQRRRHHHGSLLWCVLEFVVDQLERLMEYINSWAFGKCYLV